VVVGLTSLSNRLGRSLILGLLLLVPLLITRQSPKIYPACGIPLQFFARRLEYTLDYRGGCCGRRVGGARRGVGERSDLGLLSSILPGGGGGGRSSIARAVWGKTAAKWFAKEEGSRIVAMAEGAAMEEEQVTPRRVL
jgi:hypothetical protein